MREDAGRTVPQDGLGTLDSLGECLLALRTSVNALETGRNLVGRAGDDLSTSLHRHRTEVETVGSSAVRTQNQLYAVLLGQLLNAQGYIQLKLLL